MRTLQHWQDALQKSSSVELTKGVLSHFSTSTLGAHLSVNAEGALKQAAASDLRRSENKALSELDGVCVGIKDNIAVKGEPLGAASKILEGFVSPYDAHVIERLKRAGAIIVGRLNCDEFAMGSSTEKSAFHVCKNPWNEAHSPGGSSGGSAAAVAGGLVPLALGTDTGGSIRQPAAFCGIVGMKPTYGRVSRYGAVAFASSLDQIGPMAHDVKSCEALYAAIAGHDERESTSARREVTRANFSSSLEGLRVGVCRAPFENDALSDDVRDVFQKSERLLKERGCQIIDVELPHADVAIATYYVLCTAEASSNLARYDGIRYGKRRGEKGGLASLYENTRGELFGDEVKRRILLGTYVLSSGLYGAYTQKAQRVRRLISNDFVSAFEHVDVMLSPTVPEAAFKLGDKQDDPMAMYLADVFTVSQNLAGLPALSLNAGFAASGLPVGLQLTAPAYEEARLFEAAFAFEEALSLSNVPPSA